MSHYAPNLTTIPGRVPAADSVADVCAFSERCGWRADTCVTSRPPLVAVNAVHRTACRRIEEFRPDVRALQDHRTEAADQPRPSGKPSLLQVEELVKRYLVSGLAGKARTTTVVNGVSFAIAEGESMGLVGETGPGKTTIARCVLGLARTDGGMITLAGNDISDYTKPGRARRTAVRRHMQVVFQDPYSSLNRAMTIGATLAEAVRARGDRAGRAGETSEVRELPPMVGLPAEYVARKPSTLSGESGSGWRSPEQSRCGPDCSSVTSPSPRSTCRCRRRSSNCCGTSAAATRPAGFHHPRPVGRPPDDRARDRPQERRDRRGWVDRTSAG